MNRVIRFSPPPPAGEPFVPLLRVTGAGVRFEGLVLSEQVGGLYLHWSDGRSRPCSSDDPAKAAATCEACKAGVGRRWKGYLAVQCARTGRVGILELTPGAVHHCPPLAEPVGSLRGCRIGVWRLGSKQSAKQRMEVVPCLPPTADALPPCPDVPRALVHIFWGGRE